MVVADADEIRAELTGRGIDASDVDEQPWGRFVYFADPDGNRWALQQLPDWSVGAGGDGDWQTPASTPRADPRFLVEWWRGAAICSHPSVCCTR